MIATSDKIAIAQQTIKQGIELARQAEEELEEMRRERTRSNVSLTNKQAAAILDVSVRTVVRMKEDGRLTSLNFLDVLNYKKGRRTG